MMKNNVTFKWIWSLTILLLGGSLAAQNPVHSCSDTCSHPHTSPQSDLMLPSVEDRVRASSGAREPFQDDLSRIGGFLNNEIPFMLRTNPRAAQYYRAIHFWKHYPFTDESLLGSAYPKAMFEMYALPLMSIAPADAQESVRVMLEKAKIKKAVYLDFVTQFEVYIRMFLPTEMALQLQQAVLLHKVSTGFYSSEDLKRMERRYQAQVYCQVGNEAPDIAYRDAQNRPARLYDSKVPFTIVLVYQPEQTEQRVFLDEWGQSATILNAIQKGHLQVLKIPLMPTFNAKILKAENAGIGQSIYAETISKQETPYYDLSTLPAVFVIDSEHSFRLIQPYTVQIEQLLDDCWMLDLH